MCGMNYNPYKKTALQRKKISKPARILEEKSLLNGKILNMGCGNNDDTLFLIDKGYNIIGYDKYNPKYCNENILNENYDTIICFYVFNTIYALKEHNTLLKQLKNMTGDVYICVRSDKRAIKSNWEYIETEKVYKTPRNSYQRFYNEDMILEMFGEVEFISSDSAMKLFKLL